MSNNPFNDAQLFMGVQSVEADDIFGDSTPEEPTVKVDLPGEEKKPENETIPEGEVNAEDLFGERSPESVGDDEKDTKEKEEAGTKQSGPSPKGDNLFASFAHALKSDGLFQFLDDETVSGIVDADTFSDALNQEINSRLEDSVRQVKEALDAGVQPNVIAQYQRTIQNLEKITDEQLNAETEQGANLRRSIIRQDLLIRGYKQDKVDKQVERIMASGTDFDEAADALDAVREYFKNRYEETVNEAKQAALEEKQSQKQQAEQFRKAILDTDKLFEDIPVDKVTRQKAFDSMTKIVKTTDEGEQLTAVQLYADEHPVEFRVMLGTIYALTDGFTKMGKILTKSVNKKVNSSLKELERRLDAPSHQGGSFNFIEGGNEQRPRNKFQGLRIDLP